MADQIERIVIEIDGSGVHGQAGQIGRAVDGIGQAADSAGKKVGQAEKGMSDLASSLGTVAKSAKLSQSQIQELQQKIANTSAARAQSDALAKIATVANLSAKEISALGKKMGVAASEIDKISGATKNAASSMSFLTTAAGAFGVALSAAGLVMFAGEVIKAGLAMDSLERSFKAITGSQTAAAQELAFVRAEADRLGQSFYDLAPTYKSISAAARGTALEGEGVRKVFSAITEASTALGMSSADTEGALRAIGQMMSKGTVQAEELRQQLGERLPGAFKLMADALGVSQQELNKMLAQGQVLSEDALPKLADAIHKAYGAAAETSALESGQAAVNRLSQEWSDFKTNLFDTGAFVAATNGIRMLLTAANKAIGEWSTQEKLLNAEHQLRGLEQVDGAAASYLPGFASSLEDARKEVQKLKDDLVQLQNPAKDSFMAMEAGADRAAQRAKSYIGDIGKADEAFVKLSQTARQKLDAQYQSLKGKVSDSAALETWYAGEVAKLNELETKKHSAELSKQVKASEKAAKKKAALAAKYADETRKNNAILDRYWEDYSDRQVKAVADAAAEEKKIREDAAEEAKRIAEDQYEKQQEAAQKFLDSITDATADVFYDMFKDLDDGWQTLWDNAKNYFLKVLAQIAAQAATTQIVVPILMQVTGTADAAGAVSALSGGSGSGLGNLPFGQLFGGDSGGLLSGVTSSINSWGAEALPGLFAETSALTSTGLASLAANTQSATASLAAADASLSASTTTLTSAIGGIAGLGGGIYQMSQGGTGNMVAGAGTAVAGAMAFTPAAPFAPLVAIGSQILGSLLGNESSQHPSVMVYDQTHAWGDSSVTTKADDGMSKSTADEFGATIGAYIAQVQASVETSLSTFGDEYVAMLDDATVQFGRHTGGSWDEWNFASDQDMDELWAKAQADLTGKIYEAASGAFTAAGRDIATGEAATRAMELLGEDASAALQAMSDIIAAGVQSGDIETYAAQLQAFQATIQQVSAAWDLVSDASSALVDPLTEYEAAQKQINDQYDSWIATVEALGFASSKTAQLEADRADVLGSLASEYASAINEVMTTAGQTAQPVSAMVEARQQLNAQFDDWSSRLEQLGAAESQLAEIESDRALALQNLVDANEASIAELVGSADAIAHPLTDSESAAASVNKQFDDLVAQLVELGAAQSDLAAVEDDRATALKNLTEATAEATAEAADWAPVLATLKDHLESAYSAQVDALTAATDATIKALENQSESLTSAMEAAERTASEWSSVADSASAASASMSGMSTAEAFSSLNSMVSGAWAGTTPDSSALDATISALTNLDANDYATRAAYEADVTRSQMGLDALADVAGAQASTAEQQLAELTSQSESIEAQIELEQTAAAAVLDQLELEYRAGLEQIDIMSGVEQYTGSMDVALADINTMTRIYGDAQTASADATLRALARIENELASTTTSTPGFASGGFFSGGLRIVGENGPELEATGPSRIWSAAETRALLGGGQSGADISQLRDDLRAQSRALVAVQQRMTKILERWEINGMPEVRTA